MKSRYGKIVLLLAILPFAFTFKILSADGESPAPTSGTPTVTLRAESGATITFITQNGENVGDVSPQALDLPHLVLFRNGRLTHPEERTLIVEVTGIEVPPSGATVTLELTTQHGDPNLGGGPDQRIPVWRDSQRLADPLGLTQTGVTAVFTHQFNETVISGTETIPTPTDYFRYDLTVTDMNHPLASPLYTFAADYAFLMENQWVTPLPDVAESSPGAAPDELIVYYCDMFPFQKSINDPTPWLPREEVSQYIRTELIPRLVEAFRVQSEEWSFPWHQAWTSYRSGKDAERLSVALTDRQTWFHGLAPSRGHAEISIRVEGGNNARYDTLTDGLISTFHHELFHNHQRNMNQNQGGNGEVCGKEDAWSFFAEGMAELAPSVGQPVVQFTQTAKARAYLSQANKFLGGAGRRGKLNTSYVKMYPYWAAMYWRFLYEQCGGMKNGAEDPGAGMQVIIRALMVLYAGDIVDINASTDLVGKMPEIMDQVLAGSTCPFQTHAESLVAFARAIYALRLVDGRCTAPGMPAGCGFYDPDHLYGDLPVDTITYNGAGQLYSGEIESSFGIDFVEVILDPAAGGQPLKLEFHPAPEAKAVFNVQLWKLSDLGGGARPRRIPTPMTPPETLTRVNSEGNLFYVIPALNPAEFNRLGLIIIRLDAQESSDPVGTYTIGLQPDR